MPKYPYGWWELGHSISWEELLQAYRQIGPRNRATLVSVVCFLPLSLQDRRTALDIPIKTVTSADVELTVREA